MGVGCAEWSRLPSSSSGPKMKGDSPVNGAESVKIMEQGECILLRGADRLVDVAFFPRRVGDGLRYMLLRFLCLILYKRLIYRFILDYINGFGLYKSAENCECDK